MQTVPPPLPEGGPVDERDRIFGLDVVRGAAVLGLVFVNLQAFASADVYRDWLMLLPPREGLDLVADWLVEFFASGKCVTLLTFLLGAGFALQERRSLATGANFSRLALRRMAVLLGIGLLHTLFFWWGDILCFYALLGIALIPLRKLPSRQRRIVAIVLIGGTALLAGMIGLIPDAPAEAATPPSNEQSTHTQDDDETETEDDMLARLVEIVDSTYREGSYLQVFGVRLVEAAFAWLMLLLWAPLSVGVVLMGYDSVQTGWFPWEGKWPRLSRRLGLVLTVAGLALGATAATAIVRPSIPGATFLALAASIPGILSMSGLYLLIFLRISRRSAPSLRPIANVGRTALSNYLMQSLIAVLVFHPYALGLFGRLSFFTVLATAWAIIVAQLIWSGLWLSRFRFGPAEYLWRLGAYGPNAGAIVRSR